MVAATHHSNKPSTAERRHRLRTLSGFSLIEILVVVAVIAILMSVLMPVFAQAKLRAKETKTGQNLRQIYLGLMMYREQYDAKVEYGTPEDMGLPWFIHRREAALAVVGSEAVWQSPCVYRKEACTGYPDYQGSHFSDYCDLLHTEEYWVNMVTKHQGSMVLLFDPHCNTSEVDTENPLGSWVRATGVRLNGQVQTLGRYSANPSYVDDFWFP